MKCVPCVAIVLVITMNSSYQGLRLKAKTKLDGDDTENVGLMKWEHLTLTDFSPFIQSSSLTQSEISDSIELNRSLSDMI